ncbi:hypothetical protein ACJ41P_31910, partial [Azospirillum argentinense]
IKTSVSWPQAIDLARPKGGFDPRSKGRTKFGSSANPTLLAKSGGACEPDELAEVRAPGWRDRDAGAT